MVFRVWFYFLLLTGIILLLMWMLQISFIEPYYEQNRSHTIYSVVSEVERVMPREGFFDDTTQLSAAVGRENMCASVYDETGQLRLNVDKLGTSCSLPNLSKHAIDSYIAQSQTSLTHDFSLNFTNVNYNQGMFFYAKEVQIENVPYYIFVNSPIELLDSTVYVLKRQFSLLAIMVFSVATLVSFVLSRRLSYPILNITKSARKLAMGDYSAEFSGEGYQEAVSLADTLNYATSEFRKTDELRRDLVANVSHDIKTPLTMIKAYAEMIQDISGDKPEMRIEHLNVIIEETNHLERLVNDMLTLSKYESEVFTINETRFNLKEHVESSVNLFQVLDIDFEIDVNPKINVFSDEIKMGQVLYNYINNATKYVGEDNTIYIRAEVKKDIVTVYVHDNGIGIEADVINHVWDRYYKINKNYQRSDSSSGLGLSIVKAICEATGSDYGVESSAGKGTTFYYTLKKVR